jgi:hypothetical protein
MVPLHDEEPCHLVTWGSMSFSTIGMVVAAEHASTPSEWVLSFFFLFCFPLHIGGNGGAGKAASGNGEVGGSWSSTFWDRAGFPFV